MKRLLLVVALLSVAACGAMTPPEKHDAIVMQVNRSALTLCEDGHIKQVEFWNFTAPDLSQVFQRADRVHLAYRYENFDYKATFITGQIAERGVSMPWPCAPRMPE